MQAAIALRARNNASLTLRSYSGSRVSARAAPGTAPTMDTVALTAKVSVNGRRDVRQQVSAVTYLDDDDKLLIPSSLFLTELAHLTAEESAAVQAYQTVFRLMGDDAANTPDAFTTFRDDTADNNHPWAGLPSGWNDTLANGTAGKSIKLVMAVGNYADDGSFEARDNNTEYACAHVILRWGDDPADYFVAATPLLPGVDDPDNLTALVNNVDIMSQMSDFLSAICGANSSAIDFGHLRDPNHRWNDDTVHTRQTLNRYRPDLTAYTLSCIAALNLPAVDNLTTCAWTRAYGVAVGLLPSDSSVHNREYQITEVLPEDAELKAVADAHPAGPDGERFERGCLSLLAAFGALHLSNDHTYKQNDDDLKRKARVYVQCCRTCFSDPQMTILAQENALQTVMRTTSHPFGLSSTLGLFYDGQALGFLAEPLRIRNAIVPPPVAKIGLVVAVMDKMYGLPVGNVLRTQYSKGSDQLETLRRTVVSRAAAYSALHRHYGYDTQATVDADTLRTADALLPIVSAYAEVFERDENDNPIGARLSLIVTKCLREQAGICNMYTNAFIQYMNSSKDLKALVSGTSTAAAPAAAP